MEEVIAKVSELSGQITTLFGGMKGIYAALVALALLTLVFMRVGK